MPSVSDGKGVERAATKDCWGILDAGRAFGEGAGGRPRFALPVEGEAGEERGNDCAGKDEGGRIEEEDDDGGHGGEHLQEAGWMNKVRQVAHQERGV